MDSETAALAEKLATFQARFERSRRTFGVSLTRKCHVACRHCINDSLPNRDHEIAPAQIEKLCRELATGGSFDTVNMTGGEPFEVFDLLLAATRIISAHGLRPTVVTSASWARSAQIAREMMGELAAAGLRAIIVSRDEFHEPRVPHDYVVWALRAAAACNVVAALNLTVGGGTKDRAALLRPIAERLTGEELAQIHIKEAELLRAGRAVRLPRDGTSDATEPAPLICNVNGPVLLDNGDYAACCGAELPRNSPLRRGHCDETDADAMARATRADPLIGMIRYLGLQRMAAMLPDDMLGAPLRQAFRTAHPADLCRMCLALLADPTRVEVLRRIAASPSVRREMAVKAALFYGEIEALEVEPCA